MTAYPKKGEVHLHWRGLDLRFPDQIGDSPLILNMSWWERLSTSNQLLIVNLHRLPGLRKVMCSQRMLTLYVVPAKLNEAAHVLAGQFLDHVRGVEQVRGEAIVKHADPRWPTLEWLGREYRLRTAPHGALTQGDTVQVQVLGSLSAGLRVA